MSAIRKNLVRILICLEIVFLISGIVFYAKPREDIKFDNSQLLLARDEIEEESGFYVDGSYEGTHRRISSPVMNLDKGVYKAVVQFHIENEELFGPYSRVVEVPDGKSLSFPLSERLEEKYSILCDKAPLRYYQPEIFYRFHVKSNNSPLAVICCIDERTVAEPDTLLLVYNISVDYQRTASVLRFIIQWITIFALIDLAVLAYLKRERLRARIAGSEWHLATLIFIFFLSEIPMLLPYMPHGGDLHFHLQRLGALAQGLADGTFPVKIHPLWNNGYGDAAGTMYGQMLLHIPALLYNAGFTIDFVYKFYIFLVNLLTLVFSYHTGKVIFKDKTIAVMMTAFYTLSPYRMLDVYGRASVGEYTAMAFLPLLALGMFLIYVEPSEKHPQEERKYGWVALAVGFFGVITSHALSIIMVGTVLVLFALFDFKKTFTKAVFPEIIKAASLCFGLSVYFLLPFFDFFFTVPMRVNDVTIGYYSSEAAALPQIFELPLEAEPFGVGPLYLVVMIAAFYCCFSKRIRQNRLVRISVLMSVILVWLASNFFPYAWTNHVFHLPYSAVMEQLQFPWRWLSLLSVFCYLLFGWELLMLKESSVKKDTVKVLMIGFMCVMMAQSYLYTDIYCREKPEYDYINVCVTNSWWWDFEVAREYAPRKLTMDSVHPLEIEHQDGVEIMSEHRKDLEYLINASNNSGKEQKLIFPIFAYKGYRAVLEDGTQIPIEIGHDYRIQLSMPAGAEWNNLHLYFAEMPYWKVSECVSAVTAISLILGTIVRLLKRRKGRSAVTGK